MNFASTAMSSNATYQCRNGSSDVYTTQCTSDGVWEPNPNSTLDCTRTVPMQNGVIVAVIILVVVTCITIVVVAVFYWRINKTSEPQHDLVLKVLCFSSKVNVHNSSEPIHGRGFQLVQQENTELSGERHIGTYFTKPSTPPPLAPALSEQNREFQLVQQENRQLSGEHNEPNMGTLSAEPSTPWPSATSHSPLNPVKVSWQI